MAALRYEALILETLLSEKIRASDSKSEQSFNFRSHDLLKLFEQCKNIYPKFESLVNIDRLIFLNRMLDQSSRYPTLRSREMNKLLYEVRQRAGSLASDDDTEILLEPIRRTLDQMTTLLKGFSSSKGHSTYSEKDYTCTNEEEKAECTIVERDELFKSLNLLENLVKRVQIRLTREGGIKVVHEKEEKIQISIRQRIMQNAVTNVMEYIEIFKEILAKKNKEDSPFVVFDVLLLYMTLCLEQVEKLFLAFEDIVDPKECKQHILFAKDESPEQKQYRYTHNVADFLENLKIKLPSGYLNQKEITVAHELSNVIGKLSRYSAGQTGSISSILNHVKDLSIQRFGALKKDQSKKIKAIGDKCAQIFGTQLYPRLDTVLNLSNRLLEFFLKELKVKQG